MCLCTSTPPHLHTSAPPHLHTSAPPHLRTSLAPPHLRTSEPVGGQAFALAGSVTDDGFPEALVAAALARHGSLDIVVNNAGFLWDGAVHKMDDAQFAAVLDCHLTAPFRLARAAAEHMRSAARAELSAGGAPRDRCFVNVSSTSGLHGNVGQANYAAAKAGVTGLNKTLYLL